MDKVSEAIADVKCAVLKETTNNGKKEYDGKKMPAIIFNS